MQRPVKLILIALKRSNCQKRLDTIYINGVEGIDVERLWVHNLKFLVVLRISTSTIQRLWLLVTPFSMPTFTAITRVRIPSGTPR